MRAFLRSGAVVLGSALVVSACTNDVVEPGPAFEPRFSIVDGLSAEAPGPSNHFAVFQGRVPQGFASDVARLGGAVQASYDDLGVAIVSGLDDVDARNLKRSSRALYVELEPVLLLDDPAGMSGVMSADGAIASPDDPTTAFFYAAQWNMRAIGADAAWAAGRLGEPTTTVAILDTGIDYLHNDLAGLVDLSRSVSFVAFDDDLVNLFFPGRHPVTDINFHGTHVASTVASHGFGAAGVTSKTTLVGIKVCNVFGGCPGSSIFAGIAHAMAIEADVANMSLGGGFSKSTYPGFVSAIQRLLNAASQAGVTMVVAAGNAGADLDHDGNGFATYCDATNVICVSATGPTSGSTFSAGPFDNPDTFAPYSNFGRSAISVAAPGGWVAFVVGACSSASLVIPPCRASPFFYVGVRGTSMASPHAAGVAALISENVGRNPGLIRQQLHQSADDLGDPGADPFYGKGRVNAATAVGAN